MHGTKNFLLVILCCWVAIFAQQNLQGQTVIDSLQNVLQTAKNDTNKVNTLNTLAWELIYIGDFEKSLSYAEQAKTLSEKINDKKGKARSLNIIGVSYSDQGNYPEALKNHFEALKIREELGDKKGMASSYNNIGNIYEEQGNYPEALKNHVASLKIKQELGDKAGIATSYNNIGNIYADQHNYSEALKNHLASLKIKKEMGDMDGIAMSYNNIGTIYEEQGNYSEALKNHLVSLKIFEDIGDKEGIAASYSNLGLVNIQLKNFDEAKKYLNDALLLSKEIGYMEVIKESYYDLSVLDSAQGKDAAGIGSWQEAALHYADAYEDHKMYIIYRDSLVNEETAKKTKQIELQYEFDKEQDRIKKEQERINRRNILQYTVILLCSLFVIGLVMSLGVIKVSQPVASGLIFISLLLLFEFILVFIDPYVDNITKGVPVYKLLVNISLATMIFPVHRFLERRFKNRVIKEKKK